MAFPTVYSSSRYIGIPKLLRYQYHRLENVPILLNTGILQSTNGDPLSKNQQIALYCIHL